MMTLGLCGLSAPALAFGGCGEHGATECYRKVRTPDVYANVARPVVVAPARRETVYQPPVIQNRPYRVQVAPARIHAIREPAQYSTVLRRRLVEPARVGYVTEPPVVRRVAEEVTVAPGGVRWQRSYDFHGREVLCKVPVRPVTRTVVRDVVVAPARRVAVSTPAVYRDVAVPVLVSPARTRHVVEPPVYAVEHRPVVLRPAAVHVVEHPPVIAVEQQRVLVSRGTEQWQRTGGEGHDWGHHDWFHD